MAAIKPIIIGIGGSRQAGKDTASIPLTKKYGFFKYAFADVLKEICVESFGVSGYDLNNPLKKDIEFKTDGGKITPFVVDMACISVLIDQIEEKANIVLTQEQRNNIIIALNFKSFSSLRSLIQYVGTDVIRKYVSDTFFVDFINSQIKDKEFVVITDVRFPNERKFIKSLNGKLVLIKKDKKETTEADRHITETSLGKKREYNKIIFNNGTAEQLHEKIEKYVSKLIKKKKFWENLKKWIANILSTNA